MTWEQQQEIIVKLERRFLPLLVKNIRRVYRRGLSMYRDGKGVSNEFFDEEFMNLIMKIYTASGVTMARYIYREMPTKRELKQMGISQRWLAAVRNTLGRFALEFVTDIIGTLRNDMIDLFKKATEEGWSYERLVRELLNERLQ